MPFQVLTGPPSPPSGLGADYYTRLERGNINGVSETVLEEGSRTLTPGQLSALYSSVVVASSSRPSK